MTYPETGISEQQPLDLHPFNYIISDNYFDDSDDDEANQNDINPADEHHDFDFNDILPFLEEDDPDYDLEGAICHYEADTGYQDEGEVRPPVPVSPDPPDPPVLRRAPPPHQ